MRAALVISLTLCAATMCGASWRRGIDPGGDSSVPYEVRRSTFTSDYIVKGIVDSVGIAHAHLHAPVSFISLRPQSFLKGESRDGELVFYRFGDWRTKWLPSRSKQGVMSISDTVGDTVIVWLEIDGRGEFFSRGIMAIKMGDVAWIPRDESRLPSRSLKLYEEWVNGLTEERSLERLATTSDLVVVGSVGAHTYGEIGGRSHTVAGISVQQVLRGITEDATLEVALPIHKDPVQRDFVELPLGETAVLFLTLGDDGLYRVNGGSEGAFLVIQGTRCIPAPTRGSQYSGLPCEIAGRASHFSPERQDLHLPDIEGIVAGVLEGATSN